MAFDLNEGNHLCRKKNITQKVQLICLILIQLKILLIIKNTELIFLTIAKLKTFS